MAPTQRPVTNSEYAKFASQQSWSSYTPGAGSGFFDDIPVGHEADRQIGWAVTNRITSGVGQGRFDPDGTVTRAQIVTFLYRINNLLESE